MHRSPSAHLLQASWQYCETSLRGNLLVAEVARLQAALGRTPELLRVRLPSYFIAERVSAPTNIHDSLSLHSLEHVAILLQEIGGRLKWRTCSLSSGSPGPTYPVRRVQYHTTTRVCEPLFSTTEGKDFQRLLLGQPSTASREQARRRRRPADEGSSSPPSIRSQISEKSNCSNCR